MSVLAASVIVELCGREVARESILRHLTGIDVGAWTLVVFLTAAVAPAWWRLRRHQTAILFSLLFAAGLAAQLHLGARLQGDGFYSFACLRSLAFDGDVDFANEYRMLGLGDTTSPLVQNATAHADSPWTIGPAIAWAPFFAGGHMIARRLHTRDPAVTVDGTSFPYRQAVCIAGLFYGLLGAWFCLRLASRYYPGPLAALVTAAVFLGSFMLWYIVKEPSMAHAPSMAAVAGFTWAWVSTRGSRSTRNWALLGALAGVMTLIRWQNVIFAILPACDGAAALWSTFRTGDRRGAIRTIACGAVFTACAVLAFVPQMLAWKSIYGSYLGWSPTGPDIGWGDPHIVDILWSSRNGLLSTSPVLYLAAIGVGIFAATQISVGLPMLLAAAVMVYLNAAIADWWGGDGFGMRRFDGLIPVFAIGLAALATWLTAVVKRVPALAAAAVLTSLIVFNLTLMSAAHSGRVRLGEAVSFGEANAAQAEALHRWIGMPSTYPASLFFALRGNVSPADYDVLSPNRMLGDSQKPYGIVDVGSDDESFIEDGWYPAERDGSATFRWAAAHATLKLPLDHAAPLKVQVRLRAFSPPGVPSQNVTVVVNGQRLGRLAVGSAWQLLEVMTDARAWHAGVNRIGLAFERAARPVDVGAGGDTRILAAAIDYVRIEDVDAVR